MLTPTVRYLGSAHPLNQTAVHEELPAQAASLSPRGEGRLSSSKPAIETRFSVRLVGLLTTIAMFARPDADALATGSWR
jgi:hypothetical protein